MIPPTGSKIVSHLEERVGYLDAGVEHRGFSELRPWRLNHLNLAVPLVSESKKLFETYFGFRAVFDRGDDKISVLVDDTGFILALSNFENATTVEYPRAFHIGFAQNSREQVDRLYERLKTDGFDVKTPKEFHGAWTFYFHAPGGFLVEVFHQEM